MMTRTMLLTMMKVVQVGVLQFLLSLYYGALVVDGSKVEEDHNVKVSDSSNSDSHTHHHHNHNNLSIGIGSTGSPPQQKDYCHSTVRGCKQYLDDPVEHQKCLVAQAECGWSTPSLVVNVIIVVLILIAFVGICIRCFLFGKILGCTCGEKPISTPPTEETEELAGEKTQYSNTKV